MLIEQSQGLVNITSSLLQQAKMLYAGGGKTQQEVVKVFTLFWLRVSM
jgi:hypothetical protein